MTGIALRARVQHVLETHLFQIRRAEPLPARLGHRRIFVLPTGLGLAFGATLVTMLLASMNYALSLGYAVTFLLAGVGLVSLHQTFRNLIGLELIAARLGPSFCGTDAQLELVFRNALDRPRIHLDVFLDPARPTRFSIDADAITHVTVPVPTQRRGWLATGRLTLETRFPLGLIRGWSYLTPAARNLVYPCPETPPLPLPAPAYAHQDGQGGSTGEDDFAGLRDYRPGDSPRRVAWKLAARTDGHLHTKLFSGGQRSELALDWHALPTTLDVEARLSRLTAWVLSASQSNQVFSLRLPGFASDRSCGEAHLASCLRALALHGESRGQD
ncbi:MAG: DUF58 domain-containing protein [Rhodocyclaceae bacterium]|nr:DUF58 domain-containing protein [Rhodocyclaceae bacterium]